jgi:hypothetical protein
VFSNKPCTFQGKKNLFHNIGDMCLKRTRILRRFQKSKLNFKMHLTKLNKKEMVIINV